MEQPEKETEVINVGKANEPKQVDNTNLKSNLDSGENALLKKEDHLNTNENLQPHQPQPSNITQGQNQQGGANSQVPAQPLIPKEVSDVEPTKYVAEKGFDKELPKLLKKYGTSRPTTVLEKEIGNTLIEFIEQNGGKPPTLPFEP